MISQKASSNRFLMKQACLLTSLLNTEKTIQCKFQAKTIHSISRHIYGQVRLKIDNQKNLNQCIHTSAHRHLFSASDKEYIKEEKRIALKQEEFFDYSERNKKTFVEAIRKYTERENILRRGHVEFIKAAMARMEEFGVHKDIQIYKALFNVFPKERFVAKTMWQIEFRHYPKQQNCGMDILIKMEKNAVIPDDEMGHLIVKIFGLRSQVMYRYQRMMYWMPKFKNLNPYPIPLKLPDDTRTLALIALKRMSVDYETVLTLYEASDLENAFDKTFIASAQCPKQRELLSKHPSETAIFVEGGYNVWLRTKSLTYFTLRADNPEEKLQAHKKEDEDLLESIPFFEEQNYVIPRPSVHEQDDGIILGMCITGSSSKDSLVSWIKFLERTNPKLSDIPVVFKLRTPEDAVTIVKDGERSPVV